MFTSTTAETAYPTGLPLGLRGQADAAAGDVNGAADTRTTTIGSSVFSQTSTNPGTPLRGAIVRSIEVLTVGITTPTIKLQDQGGQKDLTPTIATDALKRVEFGAAGVPVIGGFRVVSAGGTAAICAITYDLVPY